MFEVLLHQWNIEIFQEHMELTHVLTTHDPPKELICQFNVYILINSITTNLCETQLTHFQSKTYFLQ